MWSNIRNLDVYLVLILILRKFQSQSEFSIDDDMSNTEAIKCRAKDPKRPKSPRLMKQMSGGDNSVPRPGTLER